MAYTEILPPDAGYPRGDDAAESAALNGELYYGLAGELVRAIEPETEADPTAILLQLLAAFGNAVGRGPYFAVGACRHYMNLFAVCVGRTSKSRKGTSWAPILDVLAGADPRWATERILSGLASGEGLVDAVRDPLSVKEPVREKGRVVDYQMVVRDAGVEDKRLLVFEPELGRALRAMQRHGNTLSAILRLAWDGGDLRVLSRLHQQATAPHISVVGHITRPELRRLLTEEAALNGFGNRFLWLHVERSKSLAYGGCVDPDVLAPIRARLTEALAFARTVGEMERSREAQMCWALSYEKLTRDRPGLIGALTSRAEAQVLRLSCLHALLDRSATVLPDHLAAALALWEMCEESTESLFGDGLDDPIAEKILAGLRRHQREGLSQSEVSELLAHKVPAYRIQLATDRLLRDRLIVCDWRASGGRRTLMWYLADPEWTRAGRTG
jgi:hypothetical protein